MESLFTKLPNNSFLKNVLMDLDSKLQDIVIVSLNEYKKALQSEDKDQIQSTRARLRVLHARLVKEVMLMASPKLSKYKRLFLRFGILDTSFLSQLDQQYLLAIPFNETTPDENIFYIDEWVIAIATGKIMTSTFDEVSRSKSMPKKSNNVLLADIDKIQGIITAEKEFYKKNYLERKKLEKIFLDITKSVLSHKIEAITSLADCYNKSQLDNLSQLTILSKDLRKFDKLMSESRKRLERKLQELDEIENELSQQTDTNRSVSTEAITTEFNSLQQMFKMTVGKQGNPFPIMNSMMLPRKDLGFNIKNVVASKTKHIEELDPDLYTRIYRRTNNRIPAYYLLIPSFGNLGACWEPYNRRNKASSPGRIAVPIFSRSPLNALLIGIADFRWKHAKESASYHWIEEGLTGHYYQYMVDHKIKGDPRISFIQDYLLWILKESNGTQKLDKDARYVFWRYAPFPDKLKIELTKKGFYYNELWEKEQVWRKHKDY